jgi:hypothetical protein
MARGGECSTRFGIVWTFFAEGGMVEMAIRNMIDYMHHYDNCFWLPRQHVKRPLLPA